MSTKTKISAVVILLATTAAAIWWLAENPGNHDVPPSVGGYAPQTHEDAGKGGGSPERLAPVKSGHLSEEKTGEWLRKMAAPVKVSPEFEIERMVIDPVFSYSGGQIKLKGEDIECYPTILNGGRGALLFGASRAGRHSDLMIGELFLENGVLKYERRLRVVFPGDSFYACYLLEGANSDPIRRFGIAFFEGNLLLKDKQSEAEIELLEEKTSIKGDSLTGIPFETPPPTNVLFGKAGGPYGLADQPARIMWFDIDPVSGVISRSPGK